MDLVHAGLAWVPWYVAAGLAGGLALVAVLRALTAGDEPRPVTSPPPGEPVRANEEPA